ncbi:MAG: hypothetical protein ACI959_001304 [Limisphaerales bacterium]|jgi:hypothetical protein
MLFVALSLYLSNTRAQTIIDSKSLQSAVDILELPQPDASNIEVANPAHSEKRCYDNALKQAPKRLTRALNQTKVGSLEAFDSKLNEAFTKLGIEDKSPLFTAFADAQSAADFSVSAAAAYPTIKPSQWKAIWNSFSEALSYKTITIQDDDCTSTSEFKVTYNVPWLAGLNNQARLTGKITTNCTCPRPIEKYVAHFATPADFLFYTEFGTSITMTLDAAATKWYVDKLSCCKNPKEEDEEPRVAIAESSIAPLDESDIENEFEGTGESDKGNTNYGNIGRPFNDPIITGYGGLDISTGNQIT